MKQTIIIIICRIYFGLQIVKKTMMTFDFMFNCQLDS